MELHLGIMTNKELAEWFGVTEKTLRSSKQRRMKILKDYASFEEVRGKINILKIYIPVYVKKGSQQFELVKSHIDETWAKNGLDTKKHVSDQIYAKKEEYGIIVAKSTNYSYVCQGANQLYGRPTVNEYGEIGKCRYALCVLDAVTNEVRWFTEEEYAKRQELRKKYFDSKESKDLQDHKEAILKQVKLGELNDKEAAEQIYFLEKQPYFDYLDALEDALGDNTLIYRTYVQREYNWGEPVEVKEGK
jgi:hypothetical protein